MSPFEVLHGFEPDLPSPLTYEPIDYSSEEFEKMAI
jgi:hypothetical protein